MEACRNRFYVSGAESCGDEWSGFPELRVDPRFDPFAQMPLMWSATSQHFMEVALVASGASNLQEWSERLDAAQEAAWTRLSDARRAGAVAQLDGWAVSPAAEPGLTFYALTPWDVTARFTRREVCASLALWLLLQVIRTASEHEPDFAQRMESQAMICIALAFGEGAREIVHSTEKARRSKTASACASAGHAHRNRRMERMLEEFREGAWTNKAAAARLLAARHHFSEATVRKRLQGL